ncbi:MAG: CRISPR-associated primase-polymerase type A1 [Thermodesulfobacteriota bacterium]
MTISEIEAQIKTDPFNPIHHIALAKAYLDEGDEERSRKVIAIKRRLPSKDPLVHFEWGKLCEELGMSRQARESYEQAIALNPKNPEYHFRLALLFHEKGAWERTLKHLQKTIVLSPENLQAKKMLASLYEEMGFGEAARFLKGVERKSSFIPQTISFELREKEATLILNLFKGREVGYAQYHIGSSANVIHSYVYGIMGFNQISEHVKGEKTFGVYPLRSDKTLKFSSIRVRIPWRKMVENIKNSGFLAISEDHVHHYARMITETVKGYGIPTYLENPGDRERRVWFFFEEFIPLELAERFLSIVLDKTQSPGVDLSIDFLLGFKGAGIGWEDHPVMLPFGVNRGTGKRCFFIDEYGTPYEDQLLLINKIRTISRNEIKDFLKGLDKVSRLISDRSIHSLKRLEQRCPVLEEIIRKARSGRKLRNEEKLVVFFTLGFLKEGKKILHDVLENCPDYRPNKLNRMASKLRGNPISCPKIRELMPETTAYLPCNCSFEIPKGGYPSPLLHADPGLVPIKRHVHDEQCTMNYKPKRAEDKQRTINEIETQYLLLYKKIEKLTKEKEELEAMMRMINNGQRTKDHEP